MPNYWFDHIHLMSPDPAATAAFYEKMFGARKVSEHDLGGGRAFVKLDLNGTTILVSRQASDDAPAGLVHFGIGTDDLATAVPELKAQGVEFTMEPRELRPGFTISFLTAPENVPIELQEGSA